MWLFDTSPFVPRANCGEWPDWLIALAVLSNVGIAISYYLIPINLYRFYAKRADDYQSSWIILLFVIFIASCGTTHLVDAMMFRWPMYRFLVLLDLFTAIVSLLTAYLLPRVIKRLIIVESVDKLVALNTQLNEEIVKRKEIEKSVRQSNHDLAGQVQLLTNQLRIQGWIGEKQADLEKLHEVIANLRKTYAGTDKTAS